MDFRRCTHKLRKSSSSRSTDDVLILLRLLPKIDVFGVLGGLLYAQGGFTKRCDERGRRARGRMELQNVVTRSKTRSLGGAAEAFPGGDQ